MVRTVDHALKLLFAIAEARDSEVTLTGLSKQFDLPKASVLRLLRTLEQHGLIVRDEKRKIGLGFSVLGLADAFQRHVALGPLSLPHLRWLRDATGETTTLQIALGFERACIQQVESLEEVKWSAELGQRFPLFVGAAGKVLLAFQPEEETRTILPKLVVQASALQWPFDLDAFKRALEDVRRKGYAISINETRMGPSAVAAPVRNHAGRVVAAMAAIGPVDRLPKKRLVELGPVVIQAADALATCGRVRMFAGNSPQ